MPAGCPIGSVVWVLHGRPRTVPARSGCSRTRGLWSLVRSRFADFPQRSLAEIVGQLSLFDSLAVVLGTVGQPCRAPMRVSSLGSLDSLGAGGSGRPLSCLDGCGAGIFPRGSAVSVTRPARGSAGTADMDTSNRERPHNLAGRLRAGPISVTARTRGSPMSHHFAARVRRRFAGETRRHQPARCTRRLPASRR